MKMAFSYYVWHWKSIDVLCVCVCVFVCVSIGYSGQRTNVNFVEMKVEKK